MLGEQAITVYSIIAYLSLNANSVIMNIFAQKIELPDRDQELIAHQTQNCSSGKFLKRCRHNSLLENELIMTTDETEAKKQVHIPKNMFGFEATCGHFVIDPLFGPIGLTESELAVTKTYLFQRLKNVKQLGFASDFYPGANHTRFEHSVGTLHTTWELFKRFIINCSSHNVWLKNFDIGYFYQDNVLDALRLSGLLHDVGHGPYSHTFETIFEDIPSLKFMSHEALTLFMLSYGLDKAIMDSDNKTVQGLKYIAAKTSNGDWLKFNDQRRELSEAIGGIDIQRHILMILNRDIFFSNFTPSEGFTKTRRFLNELITGDIGSDRVDYLLRDTYFTGLGHRFSLNQILDSAAGIFDTRKGFLRFAIDAESRNAVEFLLTTRYYHYRLIAHNPANLDKEFQFRCNIAPSLESNPLKALKFATLDDNEIQRHFAQSQTKWSRVFSSDMRDISVSPYKFFFYRITSDKNLKKKYLSTVNKNIWKEVKEGNPNTHIKIEHICSEVILEKPHIPILPVYRKEYRVEKKESIQYHSSLLHDWSEIIRALGKTYLLDSLLTVYAPEEYEDEVAQAIRLSRKCYLSKFLFKRFLSSNLNQDNLNRLDILLSALYKATKSGRQPILTLNTLLDEVNRTQRKLSIPAYSIEKYYEPEKGRLFDYSEQMLNDLFLFEISGLIQIDIKNVRSRRENGKPAWKAKYEISPVFGWTISYTKFGTTRFKRRRTSNLIIIQGYYPKGIRDLLFPKTFADSADQ